MPEKRTVQRVERDRKQGKSASTQAGEFVRETIEHIREGKHGARSAKQAIAIGLSKARRAGVKIPPPEKGKASEQTRRKALQDLESANAKTKRTNPRRSKATLKALQREHHAAGSNKALSRHAHEQARQKTVAERSAIGRKAARTRKANQHSAKRSTSAGRSHKSPASH